MEETVKAMFGKLMFEIAGLTTMVNQLRAENAELKAKAEKPAPKK